MPIQSANPPELTTLDQWTGLNQQLTRGTIDDQEAWWNENLYGIGPGNLRSCWGPSDPVYTAPAGTEILRMFFGYIGGPTAATPQWTMPPPGRLGWMFLSDGNVDQVDLDTQAVTRIGQVWTPIPPWNWGSLKVWRPGWVGNIAGQQGGVVIGSPQGLYAWDGSTLSSPGDPSPEWLSNEVPGIDPISPMPIGLPGIYCMEVYQDRLWVAGKNVVSFSAPGNGANFSTALGGGSFGYYGDRLTIAYMDMAASAGYLYMFGDSSTDLISNVQFSGQGTPTSPITTNFTYSNIDPQVGHGFPRPVGRWGRYFIMANGDPRNAANTHDEAFRGGIYLMFGGDAQVIGQKVSNVYTKLITRSFFPTFAPMTMFGFRLMLLNGLFTDPFGVTRSLLLAWNGVFWTVMSQKYDLTHIGSYEDNSVITPFGTDGQHLYRLFDHPDPTLIKRLSTKNLRGSGQSMLTIKNFKRMYLEMTDHFGSGVSITGYANSGGGGMPGGTQGVGFELAQGQTQTIEPAAIVGAGIWTGIDLQSVSPDFSIERLHLAADERTLFGA
ncbi:MAG: hypothetical protein C5B60_04465 [Chloroflexi bacterium]|nr:MAG: hypothetical protein C5B60_04465 [Chloroflexota bacterium]